MSQLGAEVTGPAMVQLREVRKAWGRGPAGGGPHVEGGRKLRLNVLTSPAGGRQEQKMCAPAQGPLYGAALPPAQEAPVSLCWARAHTGSLPWGPMAAELPAPSPTGPGRPALACLP